MRYRVEQIRERGESKNQSKKANRGVEAHIYLDEGEEELQVLRTIVKVTYEGAFPFSRRSITDQDADQFINRKVLNGAGLPYMAVVSMGLQSKLYVWKIGGHFIMRQYHSSADDKSHVADWMLEKVMEIFGGRAWADLQAHAIAVEAYHVANKAYFSGSGDDIVARDARRAAEKTLKAAHKALKPTELE